MQQILLTDGNQTNKRGDDQDSYFLGVLNFSGNTFHPILWDFSLERVKKGFYRFLMQISVCCTVSRFCYFAGFLRKVLGVLSFQLVTTAVFCFALYVTPEVRLFLQQQ